MPVVPIAQNRVGIAPISDAKFQAADYSGSGLEAIGQGLRSIGVGGEHLAQALDDIGVKHAEVEAREADNQLLLYASDVQDNPDTGFNRLQGKDAIDGYDPAVKAISDKRKELAAGLKSETAKRMFDQVADERMSGWQANMGRTVMMQSQRYQTDVASNRMKLNASDAVRNAGDWDASDKAIATAQSSLDDLAKLDGTTDTVEGRKFLLGSNIRGDIVSRLADASSKAANDYLIKYKDSFSGGDLAEAEKAIRISVDREEAARHRAEAEARAQAAADKAQRRESLETAKVQLDNGAGSSTDWLKLADGYNKIGDTSSAANAVNRANEMIASEKYRGASLPVMDQRISELTGKRALAPKEASELKGLQTLRTATATRLNSTGGALEQFQYATGQRLEPLNAGDAGSFARRSEQAIAAAKSYGRTTVEPLVGSEVQSLKDLAGGDSTQRMQALRMIQQFKDPRAIAGAAGQISDKEDGSFRVAATLLTLPGNAGYSAARDILRGPEAAKTNTKVFLESEGLRVFNSFAGPALRDMPPDYSADVLSAARSLYTARMTAAGKTQWDEPTWKTSIETVLGSFDKSGTKLGGITTFKGQAVSLPPGWTGDGIFRRLARATPKQWGAASVNGAPVWPDGSPVTSVQLRDLVPSRLGGTAYGFRTRAGRLLGSKRGGPYVVDVAKVPWQ